MSQEAARYPAESLALGGVAEYNLAATVTSSAGRLLLTSVGIAAAPEAEVLADSRPNVQPPVPWEQIAGAFNKAQGVLRSQLLPSDGRLRIAWTQARIRAERDDRPAGDELYWDTVVAFMDANGIGQRDGADNEAKTPLTFRAIRMLAETQPYFFAVQRIQTGVALAQPHEAIDRYANLLQAFVQDYPAVDGAKLAEMLGDNAKGVLGSGIVNESSAGALRRLLEDIVVSTHGRTEVVPPSPAVTVQERERVVTALQISVELQSALRPLLDLSANRDFQDVCAEHRISPRDPAFWEAYAELVRGYVVTERRRSRGNQHQQLRQDVMNLLAGVPAFSIADRARSSNAYEPGFRHNTAASVVGAFRGNLGRFVTNYPNAGLGAILKSMNDVANMMLQGRELKTHALGVLPIVVEDTQQLMGFRQLVGTLAVDGEPWSIRFPSAEEVEDGVDCDCILVVKGQRVAVDLTRPHRQVDAQPPRVHRPRAATLPRVTIRSLLAPEDFGNTFSISDRVARARAPAARQLIDAALARAA